MPDRLAVFEKRMSAMLEAVWRAGGWVKQIRLSPQDYADLKAALPPHRVPSVPMFADPFFGYVPVVEDATLPPHTSRTSDEPCT
jgi:hypothetical protein